MTLSLEPREDVAVKPATRWRNWWRSLDDKGRYCVVCGFEESLVPGQIYSSHCRRYPIKDTAETHRSVLYNYDEYLGAFPENERPK